MQEFVELGLLGVIVEQNLSGEVFDEYEIPSKLDVGVWEGVGLEIKEFISFFAVAIAI